MILLTVIKVRILLLWKTRRNTGLRKIKALSASGRLASDTGSFALGLRAALRQDPDVIMIGELRDAQTAAGAVSAAETGHLVLATLHTRSAVLAVSRMLDFLRGKTAANACAACRKFTGCYSAAACFGLLRAEERQLLSFNLYAGRAQPFA